MPPIPLMIGGAKVVYYSVIDERQTPTQNCEHIYSGIVQGPARGLAICQYKGEDAFYLFGCNADWNSVTDTWHETLEGAMEQGEFEYAGLSATWRKPGEPSKS